MKYIKLYEEFNLEQDERFTYIKIPFTDNEIKYLNSKGILYHTIDKNIYFDGQRIEKITNDYYIVNQTIKCVNIQDMVKACTDKYNEIYEYFSNIMMQCESRVYSAYPENIFFVYNDEIFIIRDKDEIKISSTYFNHLVDKDKVSWPRYMVSLIASEYLSDEVKCISSFYDNNVYVIQNEPYKILEEFNYDSTKGYKQKKFTDNELKLLSSKGDLIYSEYNTLYNINTLFNNLPILKLNDGYYLVCGNIQCNNISDLIKACNDINKDITDFVIEIVSNSIKTKTRSYINATAMISNFESDDMLTIWNYIKNDWAIEDSKLKSFTIIEYFFRIHFGKKYNDIGDIEANVESILFKNKLINPNYIINII